MIVLVDHEGPSYLVALKNESGEELWKVDRGVRGSAWATPFVTEYAGEPLVTVSSAGTVEAHAGKTGERLWAAEDEPPAEETSSPRFPPSAPKPGAGDEGGEGGGIDFERQLRSMDLATQQRIFSFFDPVVYGAAAVEGHLLIRTGHELYCVRGD